MIWPMIFTLSCLAACANIQILLLNRRQDAWDIERQRLVNLIISRDPVDFMRLQRAAEIPAAQPEPQHPFVRREPAASQTDQDRVPPLPLGL